MKCFADTSLKQSEFYAKVVLSILAISKTGYSWRDSRAVATSYTSSLDALCFTFENVLLFTLVLPVESSFPKSNFNLSPAGLFNTVTAI